MTRLTVSSGSAWRVLPPLRKLSEMSREELEALLAEIDTTLVLPVDTTGARDVLNDLGSQISEAEWWKAATIAAWVEPPEEEKPPPWFVPTPPKKVYPRARLLKAEPLLPAGVTPWIPRTEAGAEALVGVLCEFTNFSNWMRAAVVHTFVGKEPRQVSARELATWHIVGIPQPGHANALFDAWHKAIMKGKAAPLMPGDLFVCPEMPYPYPIRRITKKPLTAAQKRAKRDWEIAQYRPKKEPHQRCDRQPDAEGPKTSGTFPGRGPDQPLAVQMPCLTCHRDDGTHSSLCWRKS